MEEALKTDFSELVGGEAGEIFFQSQIAKIKNAYEVNALLRAMFFVGREELDSYSKEKNAPTSHQVLVQDGEGLTLASFNYDDYEVSLALSPSENTLFGFYFKIDDEDPQNIIFGRYFPFTIQFGNMALDFHAEVSTTYSNGERGEIMVEITPPPELSEVKSTGWVVESKDDPDKLTLMMTLGLQPIVAKNCEESLKFPEYLSIQGIQKFIEGTISSVVSELTADFSIEA